jgi:hypothetical protein
MLRGARVRRVIGIPILKSKLSDINGYLRKFYIFARTNHFFNLRIVQKIKPYFKCSNLMQALYFHQIQKLGNLLLGTVLKPDLHDF